MPRQSRSVFPRWERQAEAWRMEFADLAGESADAGGVKYRSQGLSLRNPWLHVRVSASRRDAETIWCNCRHSRIPSGCRLSTDIRGFKTPPASLQLRVMARSATRQAAAWRSQVVVQHKCVLLLYLRFSSSVLHFRMPRTHRDSLEVFRIHVGMQSKGRRSLPRVRTDEP